MESIRLTSASAQTSWPWKTYRPTLPRLSNAPMTYGRRALRSSAALKTWQMWKTNVYAAPLCLLEARLQAARQATAPKSTTSQENVQKNRIRSEARWSAATQLFRRMAKG